MYSRWGLGRVLLSQSLYSLCNIEIGLAGLLVSHYCKRVVLSDLDDKVVNLLKINAASMISFPIHLCAYEAHYLCAETGNTNIEVRKLAWGKNVTEFIQNHGPFDIVIGSGIVYVLPITRRFTV